MLRSIKELQRYTVKAVDESVGQVDDFYFDDKAWVIRYLIANLSDWQPGRRVLISPLALGRPDGEMDLLPISLTKRQVAHSPDIDTNKPISRQHEVSLHEYYQWPVYWLGDGLVPPYMIDVPPEIYLAEASGTEQVDPYLRSINEVRGYTLQATDGEIGHIEDFIINDETWAISYMVVDTGNWLSGRKVLVAPHWVMTISWAEAKVLINLHRETIRNSPEYNPAELVNQEYEGQMAPEV